MKLAEALILRADLQNRAEQLRQRLYENAKVQDGDTPGENPQGLLAILEEATNELTDLVQRINRTNVNTTLDSGDTIADALAQRDILKFKSGVYRGLAQSATVSQGRFTRSEIKFVSTVDVKETQEQADAYAKSHRELDATIQAANWSTDPRRISTAVW